MTEVTPSDTGWLFPTRSAIPGVLAELTGGHGALLLQALAHLGV